MKTIKFSTLLLVFLLFVSCSSDDEEIFSDPESPIPPIQTITIDSDITDDIQLTNIISDPSEIDYLVTEYIDIEAVLTVDPGVVIAFEANAGLSVEGVSDNGVLIAKGTASEPITFTGNTKAKGFWRGIRIFTNDVRNEMDYVIVEYAGSDEILDDIKSGVKSAIGLNYEPGGFFSSLKLNNSIIKNNDGYGLVVEREGCQLRSFANNIFENNSEAAVLVTPPLVASLDSDSQYSGGNGYDGVEITSSFGPSSLLSEDSVWPSFNDGSTYFVSSSIGVDARLTIMPGAVFEFEANQELTIREGFNEPDGIIIAEGTIEKPIIFTSIVENPGYWKGIRVQSNSNLNIMDYCIIEYGGSDPIAGSLRANIGLDRDRSFDPPKLILTNSILRNALGCGVAIDSPLSELFEAGNTYTRNSEGTVCSE